MDQPPYTILPAGLRDLGGLRMVENACFKEDAWPLLDLIGVLSLPGIVRIKAVIAEQMVGFISGDGAQNQDVGWITSIGVLPEYRQTGIGRALLTACEAKLPHSTIQLTVRESNHSAISMYLKAGYHQMDIWERYYNGGENGIVMQKKR